MQTLQSSYRLPCSWCPSVHRPHRQEVPGCYVRLSFLDCRFPCNVLNASARADFAPSPQVSRSVWRHQCRLEARRRPVQVHVFGSYAYVLPDVIAFGRYYPSIRSCIDCLIAMVDVNKCFLDQKAQEWRAIMNNFDQQWDPLIKPPTDALVWRSVSHFCL